MTVVRRVYYDTCFLTRENIFVIFLKKKKILAVYDINTKQRLRTDSIGQAS